MNTKQFVGIDADNVVASIQKRASTASQNVGANPRRRAIERL